MVTGVQTIHRQSACVLPLRGPFFRKRGSKSSLEMASSEGLSTDKARTLIISKAAIFQERGTDFFVE